MQIRRVGDKQQADDPASATIEQLAVAAAKTGAPVELTRETKPVPVDGWTRTAQVLLAIVAGISLGLFVEFAIGDDGLRGSTAKTTFNSKTGGPAGQAAKTTTTTKPRAGAGRAGQTDTTTVRTVVVRPRKLQRVAEQSRPSDTITALMGVIALGLGLIAATLPRLRSIEIQGIKLTLAGDDDQVTEQGAQAGGKVAKIAVRSVPPEIAKDPDFVQGWNLAYTASFAGDTVRILGDEVPVLDDDEVARWTHSAVVETTRRARAAKLEAALAGEDPAEARLSEEEIDAIVERTRPRGA